MPNYYEMPNYYKMPNYILPDAYLTSLTPTLLSVGSGEEDTSSICYRIAGSS